MNAQIRYRPLEAVGEAVRVDGASVSEQRVQLMTDGEPGIILRRIRVERDTPDRNGERIISLLTHIPVETADAQTLAALYRKRWRIGVALLQMTVQLRCEIIPWATHVLPCSALPWPQWPSTRWRW